LPQRLAREAELEELDSVRNSLKGAAKELQNTRNEITAEANAALKTDKKDEGAHKQAIDSWTKPRPFSKESEKDPPAPNSDNL